MFIKFLILIVFYVILVCSLRACHMWLTRNHMFIREILGKFTLFIFLNFEISKISKFQNSELSKFIPNFPLKHVITLLVLICDRNIICRKLFTSSPNVVREVKSMSPSFKHFAWYFTLLSILIWIARSVLSLNSKQFYQKLYSNNFYMVDVTCHF